MAHVGVSLSPFGLNINILLEYVEGGTLTSFFELDHPTSENDMVEFWTNFVEILEPLHRLHSHHDQEQRHEIGSG